MNFLNYIIGLSDQKFLLREQKNMIIKKSEKQMSFKQSGSQYLFRGIYCYSIMNVRGNVYGKVSIDLFVARL